MKVLLRLGTLPMLLLAASCGSDVPVAPSAAAQFDFSSSKLEHLARYQDGPPPSVPIVVKIIGPEGGRISLGAFEVIVPPDALPAAIPLSIRLPVEPHGSGYVHAHFGPHRQFAIPVTIRLPLKGTTSEGEGSTRIVWWSGTEWVPFETRVLEDGRLETQTSHFSEYGVEGGFYKGIILGNRPCGSKCGN